MPKPSKYVNANGELYKLAVLRVTEADPESGKIYSVDIIRDDDVAELSENPKDNQFWLAYLPVRLLNIGGCNES